MACSKDLIARAQAGDKDAIKEIIDSHEGLVKRIALKCAGGGRITPDMLQEGQLGLLTAIRKYDPTRNRAFTTLAWTIIYRHISKHLDGEQRKEFTNCHVGNAWKSNVNKTTFTADVTVNADNFDAEGPYSGDIFEQTPAPEGDEDDSPPPILRHLDILPGLEREIVERHFGFRGTAETIGEIATAFGLTRCHASDLLRDALSKLRRHMKRLPYRTESASSPE